MRTVISRTMTKREDGAKRSIMVADVKTSFLYGDARKSLYIELPNEDPMSASGRHVGKHERAMCGTRDAPMIWQDHLRETLLEMKFKESDTHPGLFQHETRDILLCVHVDHVLFTGLRDDLMWLKKQMFKKYQLETLLMGDDDDMVKKAVYLGTTLEWARTVSACGRIEDTCVHCCDNCRSISTPLCATVEKEGNRSDRPEVSAELATKHRAAVARVV